MLKSQNKRKNFALLLTGQASSLLGNGLLGFALSMYVLEKTGSAAVFAGFLSAAMIPSILLGPLGGILADRVNKRNIMVFLDLAAGLLTVFTALALKLGEGTAWNGGAWEKSGEFFLLGGFLILQSVLGAFESPVVHACIPFMREGEGVVKGNAAVNQINAISAFLSPVLGGIVYPLFGLLPVLYVTGACFFLTAFLECFIRLESPEKKTREKMLAGVKEEVLFSVEYMSRREPAILKTMVLLSLVCCLVQGSVGIGLPYLIRTVLGLGAGWYGGAESVIGLSAIAGAFLAGLLVKRFSGKKLYLTVGGMGGCVLLAGTAFAVLESRYLLYGSLILSLGALQIIACVFSIFAMSEIQNLTPKHMIGKIAAYTGSLSLCCQPLGQLLYGQLFDRFSEQIFLIFLPTGGLLLLLGSWAKGIFTKQKTLPDRDPAGNGGRKPSEGEKQDCGGERLGI